MSSNKHVTELRYMLVSSGAVTSSGTIQLGSYSVRTFHLPMSMEMYPVSTLVVWHVDSLGKLVSHHITFPVFSSKVACFPCEGIVKYNSVNLCKKQKTVKTCL